MSDADSGGDLVDAKEVGRRLQVCYRTVRRLAGRGELAPVRVGRALRFRVGDIDRWIETQIAGSLRRPRR